MTAPIRIQRKRTPGWRLAEASTNPNGARIVDRTSLFGNPFRIVNDVIVEAPDGYVWSCGTPAHARFIASAQYDAWLDGAGPDTYEVGGRAYDRRRILRDLPQLCGRDLACPCSLPDPGQSDHCHAAGLIVRANTTTSKES
jgi:hypothetical protein